MYGDCLRGIKKVKWVINVNGHCYDSYKFIGTKFAINFFAVIEYENCRTGLIQFRLHLI